MGTYRATAEGFTAKGASLSDLFETCGQAALARIYDTSIVGFEREVSVFGGGESLEELLEIWLREVMSLPSAHGFVPGDLLVVEVGETPPPRRSGFPMEVRGTARGRTAGDWLDVTNLPAVTLAGRPSIDRRRATYRARVDLSTS